MSSSILAGRCLVVLSLLGVSGGFAACAESGETGEDLGYGDDAVEGAVTLNNPGFESGKTGWGNEDLFAISTSDKHSGSKSAKISGSSGKIQQSVTVQANTTYTLTAWVLGKGTVGVKSGATALGSQNISSSGSWKQASVTFSTGSATSVDIYGAYNGGEGRFDDFAVTKKADGGSSSSTSSSSSSSSSSSTTGSGGASGSTTSSSTTGSGGSAGNPAYPSDLLNLANWHLTIPEDTAHAGDPDQIDQPELDTYIHADFFHFNAQKDGVVFRAFADGDTTENSGYPRSELRERTNNGSKLASWSSSSGKHTMFIDQAVTHLPVAKPHIVVGQIHDADDDVIVIRLEGSKLFIDLNGDDGPTLTSSYALGTRFNIKMEVQNNAVNVYYNGSLKHTYPKSFSGAYFKAGAYVQSSCQGSKKVSGEACSAYGEAVIYDVWVQHQ